MYSYAYSIPVYSYWGVALCRNTEGSKGRTLEEKEEEAEEEQ
jgi:hypothetical protein